ncbi:hypothetical protein H5410_003404 [Solanum commersonii]|uniref:AIG1-type G domain-containing protein n=1 Tax=Solanum commersonii TaxID=4109 RepID=A0A9J6B5J8_SOLCO|nr:hypothetical protein H5410_003404 [Solanum commersonii]
MIGCKAFQKNNVLLSSTLKKLFGNKISNYMILVYTGGVKLEDNDSLNDHLDSSRPEDLKKVLKDVWRSKLNNWGNFFSTTRGKPYTCELFEEVNKIKLRNDSLEVSSFLRDLKQGVADELKEQLQMFSFKEKHRRITKIVESKMNNTMHSLENSWREAYCSVRGRKKKL